MTVNVTARGTLTEEQLNDIEQQLGVELPHPYRRWLSETNGGAPERSAALPYDGTPATDFLWEHAMFGLRPEDPLNDLVRNNRTSDDLLTDAYLPVSPLSGGLLVLKIKGDDTGSVWFWDDDDPRASDEDNPEDTERLLYRVADDWDQLMERFEPFELSTDNGQSLS